MCLAKKIDNLTLTSLFLAPSSPFLLIRAPTLVEYFYITEGSTGTSITTSKIMYNGFPTPLMFQKYYYIVSKVLCSSYRKFKDKYVMYTMYMVHSETYIWWYKIHSQR